MSSEDSSTIMDVENATNPRIRLLADDERPPSTPNKLNLRFQGTSGRHSLNIYMRRDRSIQNAMEAFAKHIGGEVRHLRFIFHGRRLDGQRTPTELRLDHDDEIEVHSESVGGGWVGICQMKAPSMTAR